MPAEELKGQCMKQVLAMARPWQSNVVGCQIPESFKAAGIGMIVNLQVGTKQ